MIKEMIRLEAHLDTKEDLERKIEKIRDIKGAEAGGDLHPETENAIGTMTEGDLGLRTNIRREIKRREAGQGLALDQAVFIVGDLIVNYSNSV
jgi:hypothetical protein